MAQDEGLKVQFINNDLVVSNDQDFESLNGTVAERDVFAESEEYCVNPYGYDRNIKDPTLKYGTNESFDYKKLLE